MTRRHLLVAALLLAVVVAALGVVGARVVARDRREMYAGYAEDRLHRLESAAVDLGNDVETIAEDLELAAALVSRSASRDAYERELHAIAAIKREYMAIDVRDDSGATLARVVAPDAPSGVLDDATSPLDEVVRSARADDGALKTSRPVGDMEDETAWYRVFARRSAEHDGLLVAIVVDMRPLLAKLHLLADDSSALLVLGAHGRPAPASDPALAGAVRQLTARRGELPALARLLDTVATRRTGTVLLDGAEARAVGLPSAAAVGVTVPVLIEDGEPWALALVASTAVLEGQERRLRRQVLVGGVFAIAFLLALSGYVVRNARRAAALQERLQSADRLAHLTEKAEKILDHIPSGVLALGADRRVTAVNRWLAERLGGDVVGRQLAEIWRDAPAAEIERIDQLVVDAITAGAVRSIHGERLSLLRDAVDLSVHAVPLERRLPDVHALLVIEDDTPLRRLEERLLHSEKLATAGQLAAGIAHEIGTPLNIARGRAELALSRLGPDNPSADGQRIIVEQIDLVARQISQLLDYVRPRPPLVDMVDPAVAIESTVALLAGEASKRQVRVETEIAGDTPPLRADPDQLRQVLVNLTMNSLDACAAGGHVRVHARPAPTGNAVLLEVEDDGTGIPEAQRAQVFDPFFTTKKRGQGTGLGLWVVAQLVRGHDADIELSSEPGAGTRVRITWPGGPE